MFTLFEISPEGDQTRAKVAEPIFEEITSLAFASETLEKPRTIGRGRNEDRFQPPSWRWASRNHRDLSSAREKTGQYVGGVGIAGLIRRVDAGPNRIGDGAIALGQRREVIGNFIDINWIWLERGFVCHGLGRAQSGTSKLHDALRHGVDVGVDFGPERIQHLMHSDELDSFGDSNGLALSRVPNRWPREAAVQNINGNSLRVRLEIIPRLMRFHADFPSTSLWLIKVGNPTYRSEPLA